MSIILPDGTEIKPREYGAIGPSAEERKLAVCTPDKYIVAMADDVILSAEEWLALTDYTIVTYPTSPPALVMGRGEVHLLRKVEM